MDSPFRIRGPQRITPTAGARGPACSRERWFYEWGRENKARGPLTPAARRPSESLDSSTRVARSSLKLLTNGNARRAKPSRGPLLAYARRA